MADGKAVRSCQKPEALVAQVLLKHLVFKEVGLKCTKLLGGKKILIVDPFCGTGTTFAIAKKAGLAFYGGDLMDDAIAVTKIR